MNTIKTFLTFLFVALVSVFLVSLNGCKKDDDSPSLTISGFSPEQGMPGTSIIISGTGFSTNSTANKVDFNGVAAVVTSATASSLTTTVPELATTGLITVQTDGKIAISKKTFTVIPSLAINNFSPSQANADVSVTITGTGFSATTSENIVKINGASVTVTNATATSITVLISEETTSGPITVQVGSKTVTSSTNFIKIASTWVQKNSVPSFGRLGGVSFSIGNKGYVGTGWTGVSYLDDFWEFDQTTGAWSQKATFPGAARYYATGFSLGGKGYIGTGYAFGNYYKDFWEYDPTSNAWRQRADVGSVARDYAIGFSVDSKGYIGAGYDGINDRVDFFEFNPTTNTWSQVANYQGAGRRRLFSFVIGSKAYVGGGTSSAPNPFQDFYEFNPSVNAWSRKADIGINSLLNSAVSFSIGTNGYAGTGGLGNDVRSDFWRYNSLTNVWSKKIDFAGGARYGACAFSIGSRGYIVTGYTGVGGSYKNDAWEYIP
jgi:hypothetical protein